MFVIGITGSMCSGASTVARILSDLMSIPVIDSDNIVTKLLQSKDVLHSIVETINADITYTDGTLNKKKLATCITDDIDLRAKFNDIMFPLIRKQVNEDIERYKKEGHKYCIFDAPLLFEGINYYESIIDYTVLVHIPRNLQVQRLQKRDGILPEEAFSRVKTQPSNEQLLSYPFDYMIQNTTNFTGLNGIVINLWKNIKDYVKPPVLYSALCT